MKGYHIALQISISYRNEWDDVFKVDSHIACRAHAIPLPCHAAKGLEYAFAIWFTQCGRVWFTLAIPCPCHALTMPFFSIPQHRDGRAVLWSWEERHDRSMAWAWAWHGKCESDTAALCKSNGKDILNPYRRGMAGERHGRGMGTAYYVWIGLNKFQQKLIWSRYIFEGHVLVRVTSSFLNRLYTPDIV